MDEYPVKLGPLLRARIDRDGDVVTLAFAGEFDIAATEPLGDWLDEIEATAPRAIVVDLAALTFLDSSGARALLQANARASGSHSFAIVSGNGPAHRALALIGLDQLLPMVDSATDVPAPE